MRELISLQAHRPDADRGGALLSRAAMAEKGLVSAPNAAVGAALPIGGQPPVGFYNVGDADRPRQVTEP